MKQFIVYNREGKILRTGSCSTQDFAYQAEAKEFVMEGVADDITQKVTNIAVKSKVINKNSEEIERDNPQQRVILIEKRPAHITNEQWQDVLKRLVDLENHSTKIGG